MRVTQSNDKPAETVLAGQTALSSQLRGNWPATLMTLVTFFGLALTSTFALDLLLKHELRRVSTSTFGALNQEMSGKVNSEIIISGSSRALCSYDPRILSQTTGKSVFDIGQESTHTDFQLAFLKSYLKHNAKPRVVLQNLDFHAFGADYRERMSLYLHTLHQRTGNL